MARIKINIPAYINFSTELRVQISDINYGGHLGNDAVLKLAHEARIQFLKKYNYSEMDIEGCGLIMTDAGIVYKAEAFHGDCLLVEIAVGEISGVGFDLFYTFRNKNTGQSVAEVKTGMIFFDYEKRKICNAPSGFIDAFKIST